MSRNFELFERIQREGEPLHRRSTEEIGSDGGTQLVPLGVRWKTELEKIVTRLYLLPDSPAPRVVAFLAMDREHRFPWICAHCGDLLAERISASVCLVEADPMSPSLREKLGISTNGGLVDFLLNEEHDLDGVVTQIPGRNIWLLPWGFSAGLKKSQIRFERVRESTNQLRARFDFALMDAPAVNAGSDALAFAQQADAVVLTLQARATPRAAVRRLKERLENAGVNILGAILTDQALPVPEAVWQP